MKKLFLALLLGLSFLGSAQEKSTEEKVTDNLQKTDEVLSKIVDKALNVAEKTGDFVIEQAPLLLQEFYAWHIWSNVFFIIFGIFLIYAGYKLPFLWMDKENKSYSYKYFSLYGDDETIVAWTFFVVGLIVGSIIILIHLYDLIFILTAPKLYLIEYFSDLVARKTA